MNSLTFKRFTGLLRREVLEHPNLFIIVPAIVALIWLLLNILLMRLGAGSFLQNTISNFLDSMTITQIGPLLLPLALAFVVALVICNLSYLGDALYQDRKDMSMLFWQSMPVSNLATVFSKIVTITLLLPLGHLVMFVLVHLILLGWLVFEPDSSMELAVVGKLSLAFLYSMLLLYLTIILNVLWVFPLVGWILLFSAFARRIPLFWSLGVYILISLIEDLLIGTQFLANWGASRRAFPVVLSPEDFFNYLLNYDILIGVLLGSILVAGAVLMRRFVD
ncbi:MAG: hypothetical protein ACR2PR_02105 [Pseudohongiellaceae bacterium]